MIVSNTKIFQKVKNKSLESIEKNMKCLIISIGSYLKKNGIEKFFEEVILKKKIRFFQKINLETISLLQKANLNESRFK